MFIMVFWSYTGNIGKILEILEIGFQYGFQYGGVWDLQTESTFQYGCPIRVVKRMGMMVVHFLCLRWQVARNPIVAIGDLQFANSNAALRAAA